MTRKTTAISLLRPQPTRNKDRPREVCSDSVQQRLRQIIIVVMWLWPVLSLIPPTVAWSRLPDRRYKHKIGEWDDRDQDWAEYSAEYIWLGFLGVLVMTFCITCVAAQTAKPLRRKEVLPVLVWSLCLPLLLWFDKLVGLLCVVFFVRVLFVFRHNICAYVDMCVDIVARRCCNIDPKKMRERDMEESMIDEVEMRKMLLLRPLVCVSVAAFGLLCYCSLVMLARQSQKNSKYIIEITKNKQKCIPCVPC